MKKILLIFIFFFYSFNVNANSISIGYSSYWPKPFNIENINKKYDKKGLKVKWKSFDTGTDMSVALMTGDIDVAYSQGIIPFVNATSKGLPLTTIGIAVSYTNYNNCFLKTNSKINKKNIKDKDKIKISVPFNTLIYFQLQKQLNYLKIDQKKIELIDSSPVESAYKYIRNEVDIACGFGTLFFRATKNSNALLNPEDLLKIGIGFFDVIVSRNDFIQENSKKIRIFLDIIEKQKNELTGSNLYPFLDLVNVLNAQSEHISATQQVNEDENIAKIEAELLTAEDIASLFKFPSNKEQTEKWFNGVVEETLLLTAKSLEINGNIKSLKNYSKFINTNFLK